MPIILNSYSRPESAGHSESDETESELSSEEGYLDESDMDADTEYSYHVEDDDDEDMDFDADSLSDSAEYVGDEVNSEDSDPARASSPSSTFSSASSTFSSASSQLPAPSTKCPESSAPSEDSSRIQMVLHQLVTVFVIYLKFAVLAILVYCVALWYALNFTDLDAEIDGKSSTVSQSADDIDTCPAGLVA